MKKTKSCEQQHQLCKHYRDVKETQKIFIAFRSVTDPAPCTPWSTPSPAPPALDRCFLWSSAQQRPGPGGAGVQGRQHEGSGGRPKRKRLHMWITGEGKWEVNTTGREQPNVKKARHYLQAGCGGRTGLARSSTSHPHSGASGSLDDGEQKALTRPAVAGPGWKQGASA